MTRGKYLWSIRVPLLIVALGMLCVVTCSAAEKAYNGHWWLSASKDEQYGFLNGYWDCYFNNYHGTANYSPATTEGMMQRLTAFYRANPSKFGALVPDVMYRFRAPKEAKPRQGGDGEVYKGPHGFYMGRYWGVLGDDGELGYVEGYLWCWRNCLHNKGGTFSKTPEEYVKLINGWYQINPKTAYNARRGPTPIAYVLYSFRDGQKAARCSEK